MWRKVHRKGPKTTKGDFWRGQSPDLSPVQTGAVPLLPEEPGGASASGGAQTFTRFPLSNSIQALMSCIKATGEPWPLGGGVMRGALQCKSSMNSLWILVFMKGCNR